MNRNLAGTLLVLLSAGGYAFFSIFTKMAEAAGVPAFDLAVWRFILAAAIFWASFPFWRSRSGLDRLSRRDIVAMLLVGVLFTAAALTAFIGLATPISVSTYTLLANTAPAMTALLLSVLGERQPLWSWLAVGLAIGGSALILKDQLRAENPIDLAWPIINAVCVAVYYVAAQRTTRHIPGITSGLFVVTGTFITLLAVGVVHGFSAPTSLAAWLPLLGIALFSTVIGIAAWLGGMHYIGAARASLISSAGPPATLLFAALIFGEHLYPVQYLGGALVVFSVVLVNVPGRADPIVTAAPGE